jgi:hypothetical protein
MKPEECRETPQKHRFVLEYLDCRCRASGRTSPLRDSRRNVRLVFTKRTMGWSARMDRFAAPLHKWFGDTTERVL